MPSKRRRVALGLMLAIIFASTAACNCNATSVGDAVMDQAASENAAKARAEQPPTTAPQSKTATAGPSTPQPVTVTAAPLKMNGVSADVTTMVPGQLVDWSTDLAFTGSGFGKVYWTGWEACGKLTNTMGPPEADGGFHFDFGRGVVHVTAQLVSNGSCPSTQPTMSMHAVAGSYVGKPPYQLYSQVVVDCSYTGVKFGSGSCTVSKGEHP